MAKVSFFELSNFFPKQRLALEMTKYYDYVLLSGSRGSGKSMFLRWACLYWLLKWASEGIENVQVGLFCESYPTLYDRHIKLIREEFPRYLGKWKEQKKEFHLAKEYGGGIIMFRNLDDPSKYKSVELALIAIDELTRIPKQKFDELRGSLRWPGIAHCKFIAATNPHGEYLHWVRQLWIERNFPPELQDLKDQFYVVEVKTYDNPYLPPEYIKSLESLPERERKAFLEGDWYAFDDLIDESGYIPLFTLNQIKSAIYDSKPEPKIFPPSIMGVDVGAGGDKSAIVIRNDLFAKVLFHQKLSSVMDLVSIISQFIYEYNPTLVVIDTTGVGQGVYDRLEEIGFGLRLKKGIFGFPLSDERFVDKKAKYYWSLAEWINRGGKLIDNEAWYQLLTIKYKVISDRKIKIQSKEELLKKGIPSPDVADALALTFEETTDTLKDYSELVQQPQWF